MQTLTSVQAQNRFGELLDLAQREPVAVTRRGRTVAYVVSEQDFKAIQTIAQDRARAVRWYDEYAGGLKADRTPQTPVIGDAEVRALIDDVRRPA